MENQMYLSHLINAFNQASHYVRYFTMNINLVEFM